MENITHSLLGATLAELALPAHATPAQRRVFFGVGIIASNLPDADLLYTRITAPPIGYLLHHRGHTHTLVGLAVQALLVAAVCATPAIARRVGPLRGRLWALIAASLLGHLVADSWNSYGVHPFWPVDARWFFGDAIFIAEPWFWVMLGAAAVWNAHNKRTGTIVGVGLGLLAVPLTMFGMLSIPMFAVITLGMVSAALALRTLSPRARSGAALAGVALFVGTMLVVRQVVHAEVAASAPPPPSARMVDVVLSPHPANPLCWTALTIVEDASRDEYVMTNGVVSLASRWLSTPQCGMDQHARVHWSAPERQSLSRLRALDRDDCEVRAWLQFGRAPLVGERDIADLRYGGTSRGNFSSMPLSAAAPGRVCPTNLTSWRPPREDLLAR